MAAIKGQQNLLKFGFQSTHEKLVDMCVPNGALLDGRSDLKSPGTAFSPPTARYSATSTVVMELKREVIETFLRERLVRKLPLGAAAVQVQGED